MAITCPHCAHTIHLKAAKPGRYRPRCPKCNLPFALTVPDDAAAVWEVRAISGVTNAPADHSRTISNRTPAAGHTPASARSSPSRVPVGVGCPDGQADPGGPVDSGGPYSSSHLFGPQRDSAPRKVKSASPSPDGVAPDQSSADEPEEVEEFAAPKTEVRGYRIQRELGRGGMGAVYLAQQLSLDRPVALKVMSKRWASDPTFVARFTREAYAAAQLSHPNIVQIHDIGEVEGARFFSMEYVPGRSLAEVLKADGKLDPETAVGYVLQAARGLQHAHDRGMIHRDVKPDNLLLNDQGLVKVADLGLVKTTAAEPEPPIDRASLSPSEFRRRDTGLTGTKIALGTPAYMSPEQCRDASTVDHRADVYSLGCTLYVLVTGRPPFDGTTAIELMTKHAYEPIVPPEQIVARVPQEVSAVIQRMMAKGADERFQDMGEVIRTLEAWLGVRHAGTFSPQEEQISKLESYVLAFNTAPAAVLRGRLVTGFFSVAAVLAVLLLFFGKLAWASGVVGLVTQATMAYFVIDGIARRGHFFTRVRQFTFGLGWIDGAIGVASVGLFALLLAMSGVFWVWVGVGAAGLALGIGLRVWLDRQADDQRRSPLAGCERLLRRLRVQGLGEDELRQFVAKFAGRHWEEFFEALFGYEAKMVARAVLSRGGAAGPREKHAAWREPLLGAIARIERRRQEVRERALLQAVEQARLMAGGLAQAQAKQEAQAEAEAMVRQAEKVRRAEAERVQVGRPSREGSAPPVGVGSITGGRPAQDFAFGPEPPDRMGRLVGLFVGPHIRAVLASILLAGCGVWAHQNGLIPGAELQAKAKAAVESQDLSGLESVAVTEAARTTEPLRVENVPTALTNWVDSVNVGVAGLLLLGSLCFRGNLMSVLVILGAAVAVAGHQFGIRTVEPIRDYHAALLLGSVIAIIGFRTGTR